MDRTFDLLNEIAHCPNVASFFERPDPEHPCFAIVNSQGADNIASFQVPEPWNGDIERAPLLFLSSNPSISHAEEYPRWSWSKELTDDFFTNRFGGGVKPWVTEGKHALNYDGTYAAATLYWSEIRNRASEIYGRQVTPGVDYALSEVVHCKSKAMIGVESALEECALRYLNRMLNVSAARVVAVMGSKIGAFVRSVLRETSEGNLLGPASLASRRRLILFLAAPGSNQPRRLQNVFSADELRTIRAHLLSR